jgi:putative aldouronate transport system permease protein
MYKEFKKNKVLLSMLIPGLLILLINNYLPMFGILLAFKDFKFTSDNFFTSLLASEWVGFKNFEFFTKSIYAYTITRNTLLYNGSFIILTLLTAIPTAIVINELKSRALAKFYQSAMLLPQFLSWVVVGILAFSFLSMDMGFINHNVLVPLGFKAILWYNEPKYWPFIIPLVHIWKSMGYYSIIFLAGITGIDPEIYEAAVIDGAGKWKQIIYITIPLLIPLIIILTLLQIGKVFYADFGLFFQVTQNSGILYSATNVIDVYVYNALRVTGDASMATAVGLYQATAGFILVLTSNWIVKRINKDSALF